MLVHGQTLAMYRSLTIELSPEKWLGILFFFLILNSLFLVT